MKDVTRSFPAARYRATLTFALIAATSVGFCLLLGGDRSRSADGYVRRIALSDARAGDEMAVLLNNTPLGIPSADAEAINAARPLDRVRLGNAQSFFLPLTGPKAPGTASTALDCLTQAVYYEAANESDQGQRAVAQVVLNRVRHPAFPHSVCGVVFQGSSLRTGCQFSFTCDGSLMRRPVLASWMRARRSALSALSGHVEPTVGLATHYHAAYVVPYWAGSLDKLVTIGAHIFYSIRGRSGSRTAFNARYDAAAETLAVPPDTSVAMLDPLAPPPDGAEEPILPQQPRNRTTVLEDALQPLTDTERTLGAPAGALQADNGRGELVIDKNKGVLNATH